MPLAQSPHHRPPTSAPGPLAKQAGRQAAEIVVIAATAAAIHQAWMARALAFFTVIFLLSEFISLEDSLHRGHHG